MSMSPAPLPPDPYAPYPDMVPPRDGRHRRAAIAVWVSAALLLIGSTCCVGVLAAMGVLSMDQLRQADEAGQIPAEMWDEFGKVQAYMPVAAAVLAMFTVVPAAVLLVLGFGVNRGRRGATIAAMVLSIVALVGLGLFLLMSLVGSISQGGVDVCGLLPILALTGCMVWCVISLKAALSAARYDQSDSGRYPVAGGVPGAGAGGDTRYSPDDDPWENSL